MSRVRTRILITGLALLLTSLTACDSDSSGRGRNNGIPSDPVRVQGTVQAGPAQGVTVVAFAVDSSGNKAQTLGQSATDANGSFQIVFNNNSSSGGYSGVVLLEATGGTYTDEARQSTVTLGAVFKAVIDNSTPPANASFPTPTTASVTILSTLAAEQAQLGTGGLTQANVLAANASINSLYNNAFDVLSTPLSNPNDAAGGSNLPVETGDFTVALAGFSRLALDLGLTPDQLFNALKADIADGRLDGRSPNNTSTLVDDSVITRLARATAAYVASNANVRGLSIQDATLATLAASDGNISRNNVPGLDNVGPKVIEHFPLPGSTNAFSNSKIFIRVNEELDPSTVTSSNVTVRNSTGTIPGAISYNSASQSIVFTPTTILPTNSTITINTTTNVQDLAGNPLQTSDNFTFTTGLLAQGGIGFATNVTAVPPANTGADINQVIALSFDRPLDLGSLLSSGNVTLMNGTDAVSFSIGYNLATNTVILAPTVPLPNSTTITVGLSGSLLDAFGNLLSTAFSQSFTTNAANVADSGAPTVLAVDPVAGSNLAQGSSRITVNFSEAVDPASVIANTQLRLGTNLVSVTKRFFSQTSSLVLIPDAPLSAGQSYALTVGTNVLDLAGNSMVTPFTSSFTVAASALTITTTTLPTAVVNQVYSQQIQTIGGNGAITFTATGTLPTGLSLSPAGVISGTPSIPGIVLVTITATDSSTPTPQTASQALSVRVDANVPVPTVSFNQLSSATNDEATQNFLVQIRLDTPSTLSSPVTADVTVVGGSATNGTDYLQINTIPISFPVGTTSGTLVTVGIGVQQDALAEGDETIQLLLSNVQGSGAILGGSANHTVTITDDDPNPTVSLSSANILSLTEGASGSIAAVLSNPSAQSITVPFTIGGSASSSTDHNLVSGNFVFPAGQSTATVSFQTTGDLLDEDDIETITVTLGTPSTGATLGTPSSQTININDDDDLAIASVDSLTNIDEGSGTATFTVSLNTPHGRSSSVSVDASTAPGTALSGTDFSSNTGTLSFAAGETTKSFMVTITDDTLDEDPESFTVVLGNANLVTISSSAGTGVGTIIDNDNPANVSFAMATQSISEDVGSVTLTVSLDNTNGSGKAITVPFSVTGTAMNPADHDLASGQFPTIAATSIPPGQNSATVSFNVVDDNISELTETIIVSLGTPTNAGLGANPVLTISLNDNEATPTADLDVLLGANVQNPNVANGNRIELDENAGMVTLRASLSNPSSQDVTGSFTLGAGSSTSQPPEVTDLDTPGTRVRLYIGQNNGSGTVEAYTAFNGAPFTTELQNTVAPGNNQNVTLDTLGNLYHTGNTPPSIRVITDVANRPANDPFDPNQGDRIIVGAATTLVGPRGIDVDTRRERMLIADFNGTKLVVFDLNANGNVAPLGSTDLSVITGVTGKPWDLDYESQDDLLFIAMTDGNVLVYENYLGSGSFGSAGPTRIFAPTDGTTPGNNIHGIIFNRDRNELYLSDVGAATQSTAPGFDTDGRIFVIQNANTVGGGAGTTVTATITINTGANVRLGNPVDISFDGGNLYVVEKTNSSTVPADTNKILIYGGFQATVDAGVSGDIAPTATIVLPATAAPESSTIDPGQRLDHNFSTRSFTIPAGQLTATTSFRISEDTRDEENESIDLSLTMLNNANAGANAARSIQVQDNDVQPTININSITNSEGSNAILTVSLTAAPGRPVTINFSTLDGTAVSVANPPFPEDFTAIPTTTLTLNEGESFKTITVMINDDANNEAPEDFTVNLSNNPVNALPGMLVGTVTIADNDALPVIDIAAMGPTTVDENVGQITFNVTLNAQSGQTVTANVLVAGVSNTFGAGDFTFAPNPSTVTFAPGETSKSVTVTINDDLLNEVNEQFTASLVNISATAAPGTTSNTITITDNDSFTVTVDSPSAGTEGGADASFTVTLSRESEQTLTLDVASIGAGTDPAEAGDFNSPTSLTFSPGTTSRTLTLAVTDDMVNEATETVQSTLSFAQTPNGFDMAGSTLVNSVDINDNDELTVTLTTGTAGAEPSTDATFTATLNRQSEQTPITFDITTGANTADPTEAGDITAPASVTFSGMSTSETVTVTVNDDMVNEATEGFSLTLALNGTVNLFSPSNSTLSANNTVADDDTVTVTLANTVPGMEPSTNLTYSATLSRASEQTLNFNIAAVGSGTDPAESTDFTVGTASISFAPGTTTQSFDITVNDDGNNEAIEGLTTSLTLTNTVNGFDTQGSTLSAMAVINDDDVAVISITAQPTTASAIENSNTIQLFDVAISVPTEQSLTVDFVGEAGTPVGATLGADFQLPTGTQLTFPGSSATPFSTTQSISITVLEDLINEANEVYNIRLVNLAGAINGVSLATTPFSSATILDDDPVSVLLSTTTNGMENSAGTASDVTFTATLSRQSEQTINFDVTAMGSGVDVAEATDFTLATSTISFAPLSLTQNITVTVNEDAINEANEGLTSAIALSNVVNGFDTQGSTLTSDAIINDDDDVTISIMTNTGPFPEGNVGDTNMVLFTVSISGDSEQAPMVNFATGTTTTAATDTGDAISDTDFTSQTGSLTLNLAATTRTITVDLLEDNDAEQNENFLTALTLNTTARGVTLGNASATATITDDDNADIAFGASAPVLEGATIPVQVNLSGPKSQAVTVDLRDTLAGTATNGVDSTEENRLFPYTPVALYVVRNNGGATGVDRLGTDLRLQATYDIGANEGAVLDTDGTLYVCSDANGVASIRSFNKIAGRAPSAAFDPNQDDIVLGAMTTLTNPKGIDLDTNRNLVFAADNGASEIKVFRLNDSGDVTPQGTTALSERPWDIDYNSATDQLFVVTTSGNVFVFDNYVAGNFAPSGTPTTVITPADGGVKDSINLHGIAFDSANDRLILSDVGIPADATDGAIFVINNVSAASGLVEYDVKVSGANTMLGNPVDLAFDGTNIYIAEKSNNFVGVFALASLTGGHTNNDVAPDAQTAATRPESVTLDRGVRRDHNLTEAASTLTFAPGETSKTFNVMVIDDIRDEPIAPELLQLTLENQTGPSNIATITQDFR
ncbi:MAG: Calx-beta domain-containing protein, partial [Planctomycetota bacterium]|nr:Calx-beta domain-containing protein [Planctomycetota bacterium]